MATVMPASNVEASYEDMFKEITRKLYGEETGNGLHTLGTPVAQVATTGPTAPEGERSFTNLQIDRSSAPTIEYEQQQQHNAASGATSAAAASAATAAIQNTNVVIQQQPEGSVVVTTTTTGAGNFKSEDHLSTAFGLAALMQNGFATTSGTILNTQAINKVVAGNQQQQNTNVGGEQQQQQRWATDASTSGAGSEQQQQQQPQIVQWTTGGKLQSYTTNQQQHQQQQQVSTPKSKAKIRPDHSTPVSANNEVIYTSPSTSAINAGLNQTQQTTPTSTNVPNTSSSGGSANSSGSSGGSGGNSRKKSHSNSNNQNNNGGVQIQKRYACTHCPYSTDRRDLYTRHENIHKDEKPFQCYACLKQFNRADHVKKHFLRMHREMQYDINKTRRHVPNSNNAARGNAIISNATLSTSSSNSMGDGSPEQKPNIFHAANVLDHAFLEAPRQTTSSSLSIAETINAVALAADEPLPQMKQEKLDASEMVSGGVNSNVAAIVANIKPKREKRFTCCYCPWSGADKWGLKRHLNTHTKPFVCLLCDYKAARSERLATHVLKVHNKRACNKCSFLADTQEEYQAHINEVHVGNSNSSTSTNNAVGNAGGSVTIYTTTTTHDNNGTTTVGNVGGGPLQEIIVNPTSMVGWRLSANGSLIPPHDLLTGALPNAATQKRGSERLFQYLEADGSDPEDYARLLKMDAISRNTASVAQDFHKAGGVHELKLPANHQLLFNNKLPSQMTTKEAAALLHSLSTNSVFAYHQQQQQQQQQQQHQQLAVMRQRQHSTGDDDENTPSSASSSISSEDDGASPTKWPHQQHLTAGKEQSNSSNNNKAMKAAFYELQAQQQLPTLANEFIRNSSNKNSSYKRKIGSASLNEENQENMQQQQFVKSSPAYINNNNSTSNNNNYSHLSKTKSRQNAAAVAALHDLQQLCPDTNKENNSNAASFLTSMEYQNLNKLGAQFQNYVKDIINKYYAETPLMFPAMPTATTTPQQSQKQLHASESPPKRQRMLSETEEYIEYLKNKDDITLTITPKQPAAVVQSQPAAPQAASVLAVNAPAVINIETKVPLPPAKRFTKQQHNAAMLANSQPIEAHQSTAQAPKTAVVTSNNSSSRKSLAQLATLLPLLADAASQQQYLTAPLDFSKKSNANVAAQDNKKPVAAEASAEFNANAENQGSCSNDSTTGSSGNAAAHDKRSSRKQAQPKKIRLPAEVVVAMLRDKYLNRMVNRKLSCRICIKKSSMLTFSYHTKSSLALHRHWKHRLHRKVCSECGMKFKQDYSLSLHCMRLHAGNAVQKLRATKAKSKQSLERKPRKSN